MSADDDIERQIMLEMEKEIERNQAFGGGFSSRPPPSFEITPMTVGTDTLARQEEDDKVQAAIAARLRQKKEDRESRKSASQSPLSGSLSPGGPGLEYAQAPLDGPGDFFQPTANPVLSASGGYVDPFAVTDSSQQEVEEQARLEAEEEAQREAEEQARREAEEQAQRELEEEARHQAEEQARREAEEQARLEAEEEAQREAEEQARREAEEQAQRELEEEARHQAEEQARREAEEQARLEAEEEAQREAEEQARREAEEQAQRELEEEARRQAEEQARREAEEQARLEAEEEAQREAEEQARREAEEQAQRELEEEARRQAEEQARREAEEQARLEAEEEAQREAEEQARREAEEQAQRELEEEARHQAEEQARREAEEQARLEAEEEAQREAEEQARREAEEQAQRELEEEARRQAEEQARREAEEQARLEAEEEAQREAEEQARREAEEQAQRELEEEARRQAEEQARREAEEQARLEAEEEAQREAEEQARREAEEQAQRELEEEARRQAEEQARREAEEQARLEAEEEAQREAEEQARREAEEQAQRELEEEARRQAEEQARREAEEQARLEAEEEAQREAEEQARREAEEQAQRELEEEARRQAEEQARRDARREAEEQARREAEKEARRQAEEQARRQAEKEARRQAEEQARRGARREAEEQARREAEAEAEARRQAEEQAQREVEEEACRQIEAEARRQAEEQARREAEELARHQAEEQVRHEAEAAARKAAEAKRIEEIRRQAREAVFREYAAKGLVRSTPGSPERHSSSLNVSTSATNVATSSQRSLPAEAVQPAAGATLTINTRAANGPVATAAEEQLSSVASRFSSKASATSHIDDANGGNYREDTNVTRDFTGDALHAAGGADSANRTGDSADASSSDDDSDTSSRFSSCTPELIRNDNGILALGVATAAQLSREKSGSAGLTREEKPLEAFETELEKELRARRMTSDSIQRSHIDVHRFGTIREPGRCLMPAEELSGPVPAHAKIQLGFFSAKQTIISLQHVRRRATANRERASGPSERSLSALQCYFESEVLQDTTLTVDDDDYPHNARSERLLTREELLRGDGSAVEKAVSTISYGDPIQVWEHVRVGRTPGKDEGEDASDEEKRKQTSTMNNLWVSDVDVHKPIPAMRTFTGGFLLCITAQTITSQVAQLHGEGTDPLIVAVTLFSITETSKTKVSETFYFDASLDVFYPQKERRELAKDNKVVAFIPNEFRGTLQLVARVYRPCCEDYDTYVDLYSRADRYKSVHVAPMKQETLLLTQVSDVFEELGWMAAPCQTDKSLNSVINMSTVYRRPMADAELVKLINDDRSRGVLRTVPIRMEFRLSDLTKYEAAFPSEHAEPLPQENETMVTLLNPDLPGARAETYRYAPCCIPILNSGYFTTYNNVYYFRLSRMKVVNTGSLRNFPNTHHTYVVQICVKDRDDSLSEDGAFQCIYGRGLNTLTLTNCAWSSAIHASPDTPLSDEFKIQLPLNLTEKHHIFFTLYATHQKKSTPTPGQPRAFKVGYAAFRLIVNGAVQTSESIDVKFTSADQAAVVGAGGYLEKFHNAPASTQLNNGEPVLRASAQTKTTVHASNRLVASVFKQCPPSIEAVKKDDKVLATSGKLHTLVSNAQDPHRGVITLIDQLPLAEILAFYPFLSSYAFSLIGSASAEVPLPTRMHMLDVFVDITNRAQQYDTNTHTIKRRHGAVDMGTVFPRTSAGSILYHFLSNDTLYEGRDCSHKSRLYAGLTETWYHLLLVAKAPNPASPASPASPPTGSPVAAKKGSARNLLREMSDLLWFLFDAILRSVYIWADDNPNLRRTELFDESFYKVAGDLCVRVLEKLSTYDESVIVKRVALFVRGLMRYGDRGRVLMICEQVVQYFEKEGNGESMANFIRYVLEDPDAVALMLPSATETNPVFLSKILVAAFSTLFVHKNRETRCLATDVLYNFLAVLTNDPKVPSSTLTGVASQLFALVLAVSPQWKTFLQLNEKAPPGVATSDKRQLAMILLWITYYTPWRKIYAWLHDEPEAKTLSGFMHMVADAQSLFRYSAGEDKCRRPDLTPEQAAEVKLWDARNTTFVTAIGTQLTNFFLQCIPNVLRTVRDSTANLCVFPFFVMLESVLHLGNSTASLQMSSAAIHQTVCLLFPEIVSRKARMSNGMVLLTFRLMSSCCQFVRSSAGATFLFMSQAFFAWKSSLSKIKSLTANALVSVAESKTRDLRLAGRFIEFQFDELIERSKAEQDHFTAPPSSANFAARYEVDANAAGGDAQMKYKQAVPELFTSTKRTLPISRYLLDKSQQQQQQQPDEKPPQFSDEFASMTVTVLSLFDDVLRLQVDDSMRFKEAKIFAYFEVFRNFLRQNALKEALKWLHRLHDAHKANGDHVEAGMVLVFIAALCFRVTEVFYYVKGHDTKGARMPYGILTHVFWQDYVRILPELDDLLTADSVYGIVSELYVCPDDPCFTMEGQVQALKAAAEFQDKGQYYEFSLATIAIVDLYLRAQKDFRASGVVHSAMTTWCKTISDKAARETGRYYLLWARMEREENPKMQRELAQFAEDDAMVGEKPRGLPNARPIRRIYKMPPAYTVDEFKEYAKSYIESLFPDASLVQLTDELTDTQPALPEPDTKRKRVAAVHRPPNHCWVTVTPVQSYFPESTRIEQPPGFDKTLHITYFRNIMHLLGNKSGGATDGRRVDLMSQRLNIGTYELDRAFPATTSAIDVSTTHQVLLNPFETASETLNTLRERINQAPENVDLISVMRDALAVNGLPPGGYMKEAIAVMNDHPEVIHAIRALSAVIHKKMEVCNRLSAMIKHPEDYALVLKAVTDIDCGIIAMQTPDESVDREG